MIESIVGVVAIVGAWLFVMTLGFLVCAFVYGVLMLVSLLYENFQKQARYDRERSVTAIPPSLYMRSRDEQNK